MRLFQYILIPLSVICLLNSRLTSGISALDNISFPENKSPEYIGRLVTDELLSRSDFMMYNTGTVRAVHYAEACAGFGAARLAGLLDDSERLHKLAKRYMRVIDENITNTANHVDANLYGILPLELYRQLKESRFLDQGLEFADGQWKDPLTDGMTNQTRYWIDDVWMIGSLLIQAYRVTKKMMDVLILYQADDGMWRQLIDRQESYNETSSSAMFGYAMTVGVKKGILKGSQYAEASQKAWIALTDYINEEGKISNVCVGTPKSQELDFYLNRPTVTGDLHGQAPILWFAYSLLADY